MDNTYYNYMGRPSKYTKELIAKAKAWIDDYKVEYEDVQKIRTKGRNGKIKISKKITMKPSLPPYHCDLARHIGVSRDTFCAWQRDHKTFSDLIKKDLFCKFEEVLTKNALKSGYNTAFAIFMAKNKLGWADKQEVTGRAGGPLEHRDVSDEQVDGRIAAIEKRIASLKGKKA